MDINVQKFQSKAEVEIKNYEVIKSVLTKLYDAEIGLNKKRKEAFDDITKINEENDELKDNVYKKFAKEMNDLEDTKNKKISNIKTKLIPTTERYIREAKDTKQKIGNYKSMKNRTENQKQEIEKLRKSGADIRESQAALENNRSTMKDLGNTLEDNIMNYEFNRINNNKLIMLHLINYEMAYHAEAIEKLTNLFKDIKYINPKKSINKSVRSLNMSQKIEEEESNEENEEDQENDDNESNDNIKKSKKASVIKSKNKSIKEEEKKVMKKNLSKTMMMKIKNCIK